MEGINQSFSSSWYGSNYTPKTVTSYFHKQQHILRMIQESLRISNSKEKQLQSRNRFKNNKIEQIATFLSKKRKDQQSLKRQRMTMKASVRKCSYRSLHHSMNTQEENISSTGYDPNSSAHQWRVSINQKAKRRKLSREKNETQRQREAEKDLLEKQNLKRKVNTFEKNVKIKRQNFMKLYANKIKNQRIEKDNSLIDTCKRQRQEILSLCRQKENVDHKIESHKGKESLLMKKLAKCTKNKEYFFKAMINNISCD